jgi:hypothetical protein
MAGDGGYSRGRMVNSFAEKFKRDWAFRLFLLSNVLWIVWGWHDHA